MTLRNNNNLHHARPRAYCDNPPNFPSADSWYSAYQSALERGERPWPPKLRDELLLAEALGLILSHPYWIPGRQGLQMLGLPETFGRVQPAWPEAIKEQLLSSLWDDPQYVLAFRSVLWGR